jgi:hypothetical protein
MGWCTGREQVDRYHFLHDPTKRCKPYINRETDAAQLCFWPQQKSTDRQTITSCGIYLYRQHARIPMENIPVGKQAETLENTWRYTKSKSQQRGKYVAK